MEGRERLLIWWAEGGSRDSLGADSREHARVDVVRVHERGVDALLARAAQLLPDALMEGDGGWGGKSSEQFGSTTCPPLMHARQRLGTALSHARPTHQPWRRSSRRGRRRRRGRRWRRW